MVVELTVEGEQEARDAMEFVAENVVGKAAVGAMRRAAIQIERDAKRFAPVDTGRLRSSITHTVRLAPGMLTGATLQGVVGTNVKYAPYMEFGTGVFAGNRPHRMPPVSALEGWARRHGTNAYMVALAIARRGGLQPHEFFKKSVEQNEQKVVGILGDYISTVIQRS